MRRDAALRAGWVALVLSCAGCSRPLEKRVEELQARVERLEKRLATIPADEAGLADATTDELADRLASGDAPTRYRAARELGRRATEGHAELIAQLASEDARARDAAAAALALTAVEDDGDELESALASAGKDGTRALLVAALARSGSPEAAAAATAALADPSRRVRAAGLLAVRKLEAVEAIPALLGLATSDDLLAPLAADVLLSLDDASTLPLVESQWLTLGPREREAVVRVVGRKDTPATRDFLSAQLSDANALVALAAALELARKGDYSGARLANNRLASDDPGIAAAARRVLDAVPEDAR